MGRTFTESRSAKEPGREVFNDMLRRIERGEANAILTWKLDRLARNFDDGGKTIGLLQRGVIQEIRTFEKSYLPADNVLMIDNASAGKTMRHNHLTLKYLPITTICQDGRHPKLKQRRTECDRYVKSEFRHESTNAENSSS